MACFANVSTSCSDMKRLSRQAFSLLDFCVPRASLHIASRIVHASSHFRTAYLTVQHAGCGLTKTLLSTSAPSFKLRYPRSSPDIKSPVHRHRQPHHRQQEPTAVDQQIPMAPSEPRYQMRWSLRAVGIVGGVELKTRIFMCVHRK